MDRLGSLVEGLAWGAQDAAWVESACFSDEVDDPHFAARVADADLMRIIAAGAPNVAKEPESPTRTMLLRQWLEAMIPWAWATVGTIEYQFSAYEAWWRGDSDPPNAVDDDKTLAWCRGMLDGAQGMRALLAEAERLVA